MKETLFGKTVVTFVIALLLISSVVGYTTVGTNVTVEGILYTDTITEQGADAGVTIETVLIKDGEVDGINISGMVKREKFYITASPDGALTAYQIKLTISYDPAMQANFDDIRFKEVNGTEISYWLESKTDSESAEVWVKTDVPVDGKNIYMYYGNGAASASSGTNVFIVFDDFEDALQGDWTTLGGTVSYTDTDRAYSGTQSMKISVSSRAEIPVTAGDIAIRFRLWKKDASVCYLYHCDGSWSAHTGFEADEDIAYYDTAWRDTGDNIIPDQWELMEFKGFDWTGHTYDIIRNDVSSYNNAGMWNYNRHTNKVELQNDAGDTIYVDDFLVKKYTVNEPTVDYNNDILLSSIPNSDHSVSGITAIEPTGQAGVFGDILYLASDGMWNLGHAGVAIYTPALRMATGTITDGSSYELLITGFARDDTWNWTPGGIIYLNDVGTSTNTLTQTAPSDSGDIVQRVGVATHADRMWFDPDFTILEIA